MQSSSPPLTVTRLGTDGVVPSASDYRFEEVFHEKFGMAGFDHPDGRLVQFTDPVMHEVIRLDEAKRRAALAVADLTVQEGQYDQGIATNKALEAEYRVVKRRIELLNRLIREHRDTPPLCIPVNRKNNGSPWAKKADHTSVLYKCFTKTNGRLYPVQSPIAWSCVYAWNGLCRLSRPHGHTGSEIEQRTQNNLWTLVNMALAIPGNDTNTIQLRQCYADLYPGDRSKHPAMIFTEKHAPRRGMEAHWQQPQTKHRGSYEYEAQVKISESQTILIHVIWGTMEINCCDQWHNPLINAFVRNTVLAVGEEAIAQLTGETNPRFDPAHHMHNFLQPVIRIEYGGNIHVLTLSPSLGPDTCTVSHIAIHAGKGILDLHDKSVHEVPTHTQNAKTQTMTYYHCVGSRPNTRYNEQELNYIHACGFIESEGSIDPAKLPKPSDLSLAHGDAKAKSARISFADWDVLVSSYAIPGAPTKTVVTLVNYPPPNMRYPKKKAAKRAALNPGATPFRSNNERQKPIDQQELREGKAFYVKWFSQKGETEWKINLVDTRDPTRAASKQMKEFMTQVRVNIQRLLDNAEGGASNWMKIPESKHAFTQNVRYNPTLFGGEKILHIYRKLWGEFITHMIVNNMDQETRQFNPEAPYFYAQSHHSIQPVKYGRNPRNPPRPISVWEDVFYEGGEQYENQHNDYWHFSEERKRHDEQGGLIPQGYLAIQATGPADILPDRLPVMMGSSHPHSALVMRQMKEKLRSLQEAKASEEGHARNQSHLLHQVLERLQLPRA
jgi:hypothetical protein